MEALAVGQYLYYTGWIEICLIKSTLGGVSAAGINSASPTLDVD